MSDSPIEQANDLNAKAAHLDSIDPLAPFRDEFHIPASSDGRSEVYFVGNSLGLQPKLTQEYLLDDLESWRTRGVRGHFEGDFPWMPYHEFLTDSMASLVGAESDEVVMMNSLTANLHFMMATFYRPTDKRYKILLEDHAFPSDHYAIESQTRWRGYDPTQAMVLVTPDDGGETISTEKICEAIRRDRDELALVLLPGVQYYSGQVFDMKRITEVAHECGIVVGFDLAHAVGNIPLQLHEWDIDFACWCTYKYLNSGPGSVGGCFVNRRHVVDTSLTRLAGWWGHDKESRFRMENHFNAIPTAEGWQVSNPPILSLSAIRASLDVFKRAGGMAPLRTKSESLTGFFLECLDSKLPGRVNVITPDQSKDRGCQLSICVNLEGITGRDVYDQLESEAFRTDWREPNVIRAAPVPLYNTHAEVLSFVEKLQSVLES